MAGVVAAIAVVLLFLSPSHYHSVLSKLCFRVCATPACEIEDSHTNGDWRNPCQLRNDQEIIVEGQHIGGATAGQPNLPQTARQN